MKPSTQHIRIVFVLLLLMAANKILLAQNFTEDYKKVFKTYLSHKQISLEIGYAVYPDESGGEPVQVQSGSFRSDGKKYYQKYRETETLENSPYRLFIDHQRKLVVLTEKGKAAVKREKKEGKVNSVDALTMIDSSMPYMKTVSYKGEKNGIKEYRLIPKTGKREISICLDTKSWLISKIIIYSNAPITSKGKTLKTPRAEIVYKNINLKPQFGKTDFSLSKYGSFIHGKFQLNPQFKGYRLDIKTA